LTVLLLAYNILTFSAYPRLW